MINLMDQSIVFQPSEEPTYDLKRKALGSAFSRSKLNSMTKCVKEFTLLQIKRIQEQGLKYIDLPTFTTDLMSGIMINVAVGTGSIERTV
jgi:hypothetical protein